MPHQFTYDVAATPLRPTNAWAVNKMLLYYHGPPQGPLEEVDRHMHSVRYDMVLESRAGGRLRCLIRSPMTWQRRRYDQQMLGP
eukprot:scaffold13444_cov83-Skeletonema_dohrnii-CCMP3373.AAC.1